MKNEILNIYSNAKILFDNLIKRDHYLSNYTINYIIVRIFCTGWKTRINIILIIKLNAVF